MPHYPTGNITPDAEIDKILGLLYSFSEEGQRIAEKVIRDSIVQIALADDMDCPYSDDENYVTGWRQALRTLAARVRVRT